MKIVPLRWTVLGSGTMMPAKGRRPAAYLVECGDDRMLLDCGHCTMASLVERGIDLHRIGAVAITHFHTDHFADLLPLIHARWVDDVTHGRAHQPLVVLGPKTLARRLKRLREVMWPEPQEAYPAKVMEASRRSGPVLLGHLTIHSFPVRHVPWFQSVGYRIRRGDTSIAYTGDLCAEQGKDFERGIAGASLLVIEAGGTAGSRTHLSPQGAMMLGARLGVGRIVLTHVREGHVASIKRLLRTQEVVPPEVRRRTRRISPFAVLAEDGMTFDF